MTCHSVFQPLAPGNTPVRLYVNGTPLQVPARISVAAALLGYADVPLWRRSALSGLPRAPYCLMGACFECVARIDGQPGQRTCLTPVRHDMHVDLRATHEDR
ncbi:(2Fe-2S)-binding protein [Burkholderia sp. Bp9012]|uniref:(2Fe-2S)-binding protein n=1 Tax=Burkholderia sp. Bp9012 TaxID=2184562 RepID=UPI000F5B0ACC|nr:(2Fe-2S)-binding protein [Burkholderia sp. Bp9012]RQR79174.1 (2Fe-2S)-binding protein [Burkholderia sp. Bp9012]